MINKKSAFKLPYKTGEQALKNSVPDLMADIEKQRREQLDLFLRYGKAFSKCVIAILLCIIFLKAFNLI